MPPALRTLWTWCNRDMIRKLLPSSSAMVDGRVPCRSVMIFIRRSLSVVLWVAELLRLWCPTVGFFRHSWQKVLAYCLRIELLGPRHALRRVILPTFSGKLRRSLPAHWVAIIPWVRVLVPRLEATASELGFGLGMEVPQNRILRKVFLILDWAECLVLTCHSFRLP